MIKIRHSQWLPWTLEPSRQSGFERLSQYELIAAAADCTLRILFYQIVYRYFKKAYCKYFLTEGEFSHYWM